MALKRLPLEDQSKICASVKNKSFKSAIEELIYNAFDADSTSIAIRVHIEDNYFQVVDNGHGVIKDDINLLGQRHTTSKYENPITSRTIHKYGRFGQSLANIIEVSESVKITSRYSNTEETWVKHFLKGKEQKCFLTATRPSRGTTVEIRGFLYNLTIKKKSIKPLQEIQAIKTFLEQISLVHCNASLTLRDNAENEIIFKIHKNRDVCQTLSSILGIDKSNLLELQVEKNEYKVTGFIQKKDTESHGYQWIYVNGRLIAHSNLHGIVNQNILKSGSNLKKITKTKGHKNEGENIIGKNNLPDYFIFINCPHFDYDLISNYKLSILEFKSVAKLDKLLEKLVKFYTGDLDVEKKAISTVLTDAVKTGRSEKTDTRNQVKQIMEKILCSHQKRINGSHLHNGVKGKYIKRKSKKKHAAASKSKSKDVHLNNVITNNIHKFTDLMDKRSQALLNKYDINDKAASFEIPKKQKKSSLTSDMNIEPQKLGKKFKSLKVMKEPVVKDPVIIKFEKDTATVQRRCHILASKVHDLLGFKKKRKCKIFTNEIIQYSNIISDDKSVSIRQNIEEEIIHEYLPLPQKPNAHNHKKSGYNILKSDDLICPVVITHSENNDKTSKVNKIRADLPKLPLQTPPPPHLISPCHYKNDCELELTMRKLTYESHGFMKSTQVHQRNVNFIKDNKRFQFISKTSRDYFASPNKIRKVTHKMLPKKHSINKILKYKKPRDIFTDQFQSSHSIHFTETAETEFHKTPSTSPNVSDILTLRDESRIGSTYTIIDSDKASNPNVNNASDLIIKYSTLEINGTDGIEVPNSDLLFSDQPNVQDSLIAHRSIEEKNDLNVIFISDSQKRNAGVSINQNIDPLHICETVLECDDTQENEEYNFIFNSINNVVEESVHEKTQPIDVCRTILHIYENKSQEGLNTNCKDGVEELYEQREPKYDMDFKINNFNLKYRRRFVPKGMSQIFENCNSRNICNYQFDKDYFEEAMYNNFVQDVHINSEIFKPKIRNIKEIGTRDIEKISNKLTKDNACLTFNGDSLKQAKLLGQVDCKFIATKIQGISNVPCNYLVLFDQHAVHERIRLENNMTEYFNGEEWKSVTLDGISLNLSNDEIIYLHNNKDKFRRLGLRWSILSNTEVLVRAIPEAVLGKNPRQEDIVLKAVKSLIKEEINTIKEQGGCLSLYPKSIMDLVFSEACRYAIMFGDALSKSDCTGLLNALSDCKTPFQCAHGRPVMAVLSDIKTEKHSYKVNFTKVQEFRRRMQSKGK